MEMVLAYWFEQGCTPSPLAGLILLLAAACLALNLKRPEKD